MDIKKDVVFIYAHMDDETILSYGTMLKYKCLGYNVNAICVCGKGRQYCKDKKQIQRLDAFKQNLMSIGVKFRIGEFYDLSLTAQNISSFLHDTMQDIKPNIVFTHSIFDLHFEHRLLAQELLVLCRLSKQSSVKALYQTVSSTYDQTFSQFGVFQPNYFVDISNVIDKKKTALNNYNVELPDDSNDIRSIESILAQNRHYGRLMNVSYCEAYQQIFKLD